MATKKENYTQLDKVKLMGLLRKTPITCYDDLYIDTRSKYDVDDLVLALVELITKAINVGEKDTYILNALRGLNHSTATLISRPEKLTHEIYEKVTSLRSIYDDAIEKSGGEHNQDIIIEFNALRDILIVFAQNTTPQEEEEQEEKIELDLSEEIIASHARLEEENKEQEKEIRELRKKLSSSEKKSDKKDKTIEEQKDELVELRAKIREMEKQSIKDSKLIDKLTASVESITGELKTTSEMNVSFAEQVTSLNKENAELAARAKEMDEIERIAARMQELKGKILAILADKHSTAENLYKELGKKYSLQSINEAIEALKNEYNITYVALSDYSPVYKIMPPTVKTDLSLRMPTEKEIDILVISDLHMGNISDSDIRTFEKIYEYAAANKIKMVVNLGDFFSFNHHAYASNLNKMEYTRRIIDQAIEKLPYDPRIHQYILGGNHDKSLILDGIDPIGELAKNRTDMYSLGYDDAVLQFDSEKIVLHHPSIRLFEEESTYLETQKEILKLISQYYKKTGYNRDNTYVDLYGHFHKSVLNDVEGYAFVPSLTSDRCQNGAWHLKLFFNSQKEIENIIFIPLINLGRLTAIGENVYKKKKVMK